MNWGTEIPQDDIARVGLLDRAHVPWKDALAATAENAFVHNPLTEIMDAGILASAKSPLTRSIIGNIGRGFADMPAELPQEEPADAFQDPKSLNEQYGQTLGLTFDQPTRKGAVSIMVRRKQEEIARNAYIERGPGGLTFGIVNFATMLAVSAADPLNVASAFIPVVGEARAALWAAKYGKAGGRVLTGAVEGVVGAAAIEPLNYSASKYLGDDYTMGDSLLNIALGGVLGGGLHAGFGAISDHISRLAPETREAALRGALANTAEGRPVDVGHILDADPKAFDSMPRTDDVLAADRLVDEGAPPVAKETIGPPGPAGLRVLGEEDLQRTAREIAPDVFKARDEIRAKQETFRRWIKELGETQRAKAESEAPHAREIAKLEQRLTAPSNKKNLKKWEERLGIIRSERDAVITERTTGDSPDMARVRADLQAADLQLRDMGPDVRAAYDAARQRLNAEIERPVAAQATRSLDRARTASIDYGAGREASTATVPAEASARADIIVREAQGDDLDAEHLEAIAQIDKLEAQGALTPAEAEAGRGGAEDIKRANQQAKAAKAAAGCLLLHP